MAWIVRYQGLLLVASSIFILSEGQESYTTSPSLSSSAPQNVCLDAHSNCGNWAYLGYCITGPYVKWMEINCPRSCGICLDGPVCVFTSLTTSGYKDPRCFDVMPDPATCRYVTINGFLKFQCKVQIFQGHMIKVLKCPVDEAYYQAIELESYNSAQVYSLACKSDIQGYQACGVIGDMSRRKYDDYYLCGYHVCQDIRKYGGSGKYSSGAILDTFIRCNGKVECANGEDEKGCEGLDPETHYTCNSYGTKIPRSKFCDGVYDCPNGDDENGSCDHKTGLFCEDRVGEVTWVHPNYICAPGGGWKICKGGEDNKDCDVHTGGRWCESALYTRPRYIKELQMCYHTKGKEALDYKVCRDGRDQLNRTNVALTCQVEGYPTTISSYGLCQGYQQCEDRFDEECGLAETDCYLHKHKFCDKSSDCDHDGDERAGICDDVTPNFKCIRRIATAPAQSLHIPYSWLCDGVTDCSDGSDEDSSLWNVCGSRDTVTRCVEKTDSCTEMFRCPGEKRKFSRLQSLCDNVQECAGENRLCRQSRWIKEVLTVAFSREKTTKLLSYQCLPGMKGNCNESLIHQSPDQNIYGVKPTAIKFSSNGDKVSCKFFFGELYVYHSCNDLCSDASCPLSSIPYHSCSNMPDKAITFAKHPPTMRQILTVVNRKDGKYQDNLFSCKNGRCVTYDQVCNLADDCGDGSDEKLCVNNFQCNTSSEFIPLSGLCDGKVDCIDKSDECNDRCQLQIIDTITRKMFAWVFGVLATFTNIVVVARKIWSLRRIKTKTTLFNSSFVVCIGVGDTMIGLYLLGVSVADTIYSTSYCTARFEWLNSGYCTALGILSTTGSSLSLFSMTCLSVYRIHSIRNVFSSRQITKRSQAALVFVIMSVLILVGVVAFIPIFTLFEDYFMNGIYYGDLRLFIGAPSKQEHINILEQYYGRLRDSMVTWKMTRKLVAGMFTSDHGGISGSDRKFYGNSGVCLFKYIVNDTDPQRLFSLAVLTFNCFLCILISVSYIGVYVISRSSMSTSGTTSSTSLERKISIIIVTDFIAWVPFIILCYFHYFDIYDASSLYGIFSIVILPVNSVINPLIYDDTFSSLRRFVVNETVLSRVSVSQIRRKITSIGVIENPTNVVYLPNLAQDSVAVDSVDESVKTTKL